MAQSIEDGLLQAIKKDDLKAFHTFMEKAQYGTFRLGRFPLLSLMYLYKSKKLVTAFEEKFLKITNFESLREPIELSKKFSEKAGKCLRLYLNEIVSPLEMLLILDKTKHLKHVFSMTKPSAAVKGRLQSIYSIKYSLNVSFEGDRIIIDKRPFTYREKRNIAVVCLSSFLCVAVVIGVPVTIDSLIPKPVEGEITKLSQINFASNKEYILKRDIALPENFSVQNMNCSIAGEGNHLILGKNVSLGVLNGKISDLIIESTGSTIFTSVYESATLENVTVNVNTDVTVSESSALVALINYGTFDGVTLNVSGKINAIATSEEVTEGLCFAGLILDNNYKIYNSTTTYWGTIKNCTVNYSQFLLSGEANANASFGGIVGVNSGYVQNCTVTGEIAAETFYLAGVCVENNNLLSNDVNEAKLTQTSDDAGWNPITSGIVLTNSFGVENCVNRGTVSAVSDCEQIENQEGSAPAVTASGIAAISYGYIDYSRNEGAISVFGYGTAYVGGIAAHTCARTFNCISDGDITVTAQTVYAGGILGVGEIMYDYLYNVYLGIANYCISECKINVTCDEAYVGGIVGCVRELGFNNGEVYFGGGVTNSCFTGECATESKVTYWGNIVGVCGANIYESNTYTTTDSTVCYNFENNFYAENGVTAFGAVATNNDSFIKVADKGATAAAIEVIKDSELYQIILSALEK